MLTNQDLLCDAVDDCGDNSDEVDQCPRSVECSFESKNYCGYTLGGWQLGSGLTSSIGSLSNTGPSFDHTSGLADGVHKYVYTSENEAILTTPIQDISSSSCLQFYFYLSYDSQIQILKSSGDVIDTVSGAANIWQVSQVSVPAGDYSIEFKAIITKPSYIAIDDVTLSAGACSDTCPSGMFKCETEFTCISNAYMCDGISQCIDSSDEKNCKSVEEVRCSFDEAYACGFRQSDEDDFNWDIRYGYTSSSGVGPFTGHIDDDNDQDISYMIAIPSESHAKSSIVWPLKLTHDSCMTFWYYMYGTNVGSLAVIVGGDSVWQQFGDQGRKWIRVQVSVAAGDTVEFKTQGGEKVSVISLSDMEIAMSWYV